VLLDGDRAVADGGGAHAARCYLRRAEPSDRPGTSISKGVRADSLKGKNRPSICPSCPQSRGFRPCGGSRVSASRPPRCGEARSTAAAASRPVSAARCS
jgi:hypothetical protein